MEGIIENASVVDFVTLLQDGLVVPGGNGL